jgi:hypothetical protein
MHAVALVLLLVQAPGDGWALAHVPPREVKTLYWELFNTTETWVSIIPAGPSGGQPLVRLIFQASFAGREAKGVPSRLVLRALALPLTIVTKYPFRLVVDEQTIDLASACESPETTSGPRCQFLYPMCDDWCSANGIAVDLSPALLRQLAGARTVTGTALGFPIVLTPDDRVALSKFAGAIRLVPVPRK